MPIIYCQARGLKIRSWVFVLLFLVSEAATLIHLYVAALPVVGADSETFHWSAYYLVTSGSTRLDNMLYVQLLGLFYSFFGISQVMGAQLSHLAFSVSAILFVEIGYLIGLKQKQLEVGLLIFGLLPSCFLHASVTMREAYQTMGLLLFVYGFLRVRLAYSNKALFSVGTGCLCLLFFHKGFAIFLLLAAPASLLWATEAKIDKILLLSALVFSALFLVGDSLWSLLIESSSSLKHISEGQGLEYIDKYADNVERGRSDFDVNLKLDSIPAFLKTGPVVFFYYLFSPLPWQVQNWIDVEGCAESFVRMLLLWRAFKAYNQADKEAKSAGRYLFGMFLLMELTWAAGTSNWGTAVRHRVAAWPLLVLLSLLPNGKSVESKVKSGKLSRRERMRSIRRKHRERFSNREIAN